MKDKVFEIVNQFKKENNVEFNVSFFMPQGYENAYGTFDIEKNTLFINIDKKSLSRKRRIMLYLIRKKMYFSICIINNTFSRK